MNQFSANWFDGETSRLHSVIVARIDAHHIRVRGDDVDRVERLDTLQISSRLARTPRTILFPDGARILVSDHPLFDSWFPSDDRLQRFVDRMERHAHAVAASIILSIAAVIATFTWGVPWMSDRIAAHIPEGVEDRLGGEVLSYLDTMLGFAPTEIESERQQELRERLEMLAKDLPDTSRYRLEFRSAPNIGANALAIPGGTIVVTDELVELFHDDRQFDAVIAHELGHQEHRHALRQTLRSSFVLVLAAMFTGDVSSASAIVVAIPTMLLQNHYSRGFEEEADEYAFNALAAHKISPAWFASAISLLTEYKEGEDDDLAYLSSHPSNIARVTAAQSAGVAFLIKHPELARETPDYDACAEEGDCPDEDDCDDEGCEKMDDIDHECYEDGELETDSEEYSENCVE